MTKNIPYYVAFSHFLGIGPLRFNHLIGKYETLTKAYSAPTHELVADFGPDIGYRFDTFRRSFSPLKKVEELVNKGIRIISREDPYYPPAFMHLEDRPICLYVKGQIEKYPPGQDTYVSVVGTRKASDYGVYLARKFGSSLASAGCVVVSGMAVGIDSEVHKTTIEVGGRTIAFLGCGVDIVYPPSNKALYENILKSGGLIISEFPPGMMVSKGLFVARNRLIAGIAKVVIVVEGTEDSGALITARDALDQGKEVFVLPLPLNSKLSEGPLNLLKEGAIMHVSPENLLKSIHLEPVPMTENVRDYSGLELPERDIVELLSFSPRSIDELTERLETSVVQNMALISALELKGLIVKNHEGKYRLKT